VIKNTTKAAAAAAAVRFRCFDDAFDDLVPAGRFDNGVINRRD